ncbi:MAG TPA: tetratricopeptide repeat protein [Thermoanaerobaculia bacterium]|jgi:predicted Zn-dependent protease
MKTMMKYSLILLAALTFPFTAVAQDFPSEPHEFLLAKEAADEGRFEEALTRMERVLAKDPSNPVLLYERALILLDAGRLDRAEQELRTVVAASPDFYDAQRMLGRVLLDRSGGERGKVEDALKYLQAAYKLNPDDLSTGITVSQLLMSTGRVEEAEKILSVMVERAPDQRALNYNYAQVLTKLGRGNESKQYLERAVGTDPTFGPAILQLIDIYEKENEFGKAAALLQPLIEEDPLNLELQRQQAVFHLRAGDTRSARDRFRALYTANPKDTQAAYYLAESLNDLGEYAEAAPIVESLLQANPGDPDLIASYGLTLTGLKRWDDAQKQFNLLLTVANVPENLGTLARTQLAYIDLQKGNLGAAVETAKSAFVFREKPNTQAINIAVESLRREKKYDQLVTLLEPLAQKFSDDPFVNARYIEALARAGRKEDAAKIAALQMKAGVRNTIAATEAYLLVEDNAAALALLNEAVKAKPEELDLRFQLGSAYERTGDRKKAEEAFLAVLAKNPDHAPTLNYLGYMWAENGVNLERAHEMLTRAVGQEPENGAYVDSLGWVYYRLGNLDMAEKYLTEATRLTPRDSTVHDHLGDVLAKRGDRERALQSYRTAITLDPESKDVEKIRMKIAELERKSQTSER